MLFLGNINHLKNNTDFYEECFEMAKQYKTNNRSFAEILEQTVSGEAVERIACQALKLEQSPFENAKYDAIGTNGGIYEIKHTIINAKWWNFKNYEYFLENSHEIDYIILCFLDVNGDVYLKWKADAPSFKDYIASSKFTDGYYYNVDIAERQNKCKSY